MIVKCPRCNSVYRAYIDKGHLLVQYKDIHGNVHTEHSETCKCNQKSLTEKKVGTNGGV